MSEPTSSPVKGDAFSEVRELRTALRSDLQIIRQVTKGEPIYVVYDPVNFRSHRLTLSDYRVVASLREASTVEQAFQSSVAEGLLSEGDSGDFARFVLRLDSLGLLVTSRRSDKDLYKKFAAKSAAEKGKYLNFLFLSIPLANPDRTLDRTFRQFQPLFTRGAAISWLVAASLAVWLVVSRWDAFLEPLNSILAVKNLAFMTGAFLALKVWHELGHGYACKVFGGRVPEMGCKLILGMPLAYVDASSAWSFPRRLHRIIVMLGGMYFESLVAIPAVFVWAFTPHTFVGSCAYQIVFMAGVATLVFNINPLMKFDGYFILSDLWGIPNLRTRAFQEVNGILKRIFLGLPSPSPFGVADRVLLSLYGVSAVCYTVIISISIAAVIASHFRMLGLLVGAWQLLGLLWRSYHKLIKYLLKSEETAAIRGRARALACLSGAGFLLLLLLCPTPIGLKCTGVSTAERSSVVRAETDGTIEAILEPVGAHVSKEQPLVRLRNPQTSMLRATQAISADALQRTAYAKSRENLAEATKLQRAADERMLQFADANRNSEKLLIRAPQDGQLVYLLPDYAQGSFVRRGDSVAKVVSGKTIVRAWLNEEELRSAEIEVGSPVSVRFANRTATRCKGVVVCVSPTTIEQFQDLALTTLGEGDIPIDPLTGRTQQPQFQLLVEVPDLPSETAGQNIRVFLRVGARYESIGAWLLRKSLIFTHRILTT